MRLYVVSSSLTHHLRSVVASGDKDIFLSKFPVFIFEAFVLSISRNLWCSGPYITPGKLEVISPSTWATSLIHGEAVASKFSQAFFNLRALSGVSDTCIKTEWRTNPKKVILSVGSRTDFSGWTIKSTLSSKVVVSMTFRRHRVKFSAVNQVSSIYATDMCPCCLKHENIGFSSFVNFRGQSASPLGKHTNWYKLPFHLSLRNFWCSLHIGTV